MTFLSRRDECKTKHRFLAASITAAGVYNHVEGTTLICNTILNNLYLRAVIAHSIVITLEGAPHYSVYTHLSWSIL